MNEKTLPKSPYPYWLSIFLYNPIRKILINRSAFLKKMGVKEGDTVLELGCGPGFFTETLSTMVGPKGKVYAQDVQQEMLSKMKKHLETMQAKDNIHPLLCNSSTLKIPDASIDVSLCANVMEEIDKEGELEKSLIELQRVLKNNGILIFKEHLFGDTAPAIEKTLKILKDLGFKKMHEKKDVITFHAKFVKETEAEN